MNVSRNYKMKYQPFYQLIQNSQNILVTSHYSPDPDAIGSVLYTHGVLKENFPNKNISAVLENPVPKEFSFLPHFNQLKIGDACEDIRNISPDLLLIIDTTNYWRISRNRSDELSAFVKENGIKVVIIDHHTQTNPDEHDLQINNEYSSAAEEVYMVFKEDFGLKEFPGSADLVMFGILGDTNRFMYKNDYHRQTFAIVSELIEAGAVIEELESKLSSIAPAQLKILAKLLENFSQTADYNYSWLNDDFVKNEVLGKISLEDYTAAYHIFLQNYLRNITPFSWGFIVIPDLNAFPGKYKCSFRSISGVVDTTLFSKPLGGGGHYPASGCVIVASSAVEAVAIVQKKINEVPL